MNVNLDRMLHEAKWVVASPQVDSPVLRRSFTCSASAEGTIALTAWGFFVLYINGQRVGREYFLPSNSLFHERPLNGMLYPIFDRFTYRCYYSVYDVTPYLKEGENLLEIALGSGWYRQTFRTAEGNMSFGDALGARFALCLRDAHGERAVCSDGSEEYRNSAIVSSQLFQGEIFDARIDEKKAYTYAPVRVVERMETELTPEDSVPDHIVRRITPKLLLDEGDRKVYDAGENISGFVALRTDAREGEEIRIRFSENLTEDGALDFYSTASASRNRAKPLRQIQEDVVISAGKPCRYEPTFVWHAFRYFEILGKGEAESVAVVHSDVKPIATFTSSSLELNWIFDAYVRTQLNNMHAGVPSDCPHRERIGYTGDGQICAPAVMTLFDAKAFYRKWIRDIFDSQDPVSGHVNHTAPFAGGGGGPGGWGCAAIFVPYEYYRFYGDAEQLCEYYDRMKLWLSYLSDHSEQGLVTREEEGGWCLGDWASLEKMTIPEPFVNTCFLIRALHCMEQIACAVERSEDVLAFQDLRQSAEQAVTDAYWDATTGSFVGGVQGADAIALACGLGDDRTLRNLVRQYETLGCFATGIFGTAMLCDVLFERGETDLAFDLLTSHRLGSFAYMMDHGATTIWEDWDGCHSHDHPMFGACVRHWISAFLGIGQREGTVGDREITIAPKIPDGLSYARGSRVCAPGEVCVAWTKQDGGIRFEITLPDGASCDFQYGTIHRPLGGGTTVIETPLR